MRMLFESSSIDIFPSTMANDISVYTSLSIMVVTTGLAYYVLARILHWSGNKPFPRVFQSSAFNVLLVSSVMVTAILLLLGIDIVGLFAMAGKFVVCDLVGYYVPLVAVGLASAIMLIVVRRLRAG
jgi:hypothetical protein